MRTRVRRGGWILAVAVTWCLEGPPAPRAAQIPRDVEANMARSAVTPYLQVVERYRRGETSEAAAEIQAWTPQQVSQALDHLAILASDLTTQPIEFPLKVPVVAVDAAILMHTEASLRAADASDREAHLRHLKTARALSDWLHSQLLNRPMLGTGGYTPISRRDWYLATTRVLHGIWFLDSAEMLAAAMVPLAPDDPEVLLTAGSVKEALAFAYDMALVPPPVEPSPSRYDRWRRQQMAAQRGADEARDAAVRLFRQALASASSPSEVRVRLGRVLARRGRAADARAELERASAPGEPTDIRYLAFLFLGNLDEDARGFDAAQRAYERAIALRPDAQVARVALAHVLESSGRRDAGRDVLAPSVLRTDARDMTADPFWAYPLGRFQEGGALMTALRARVARR